MGSDFAEITWPFVLAGIGVVAGWWLRHWAKSSSMRLEDFPSSVVVPRPSAARLPEPAMGPHVDPLTGLSCRAALVDDVRRRVAEWKRTGIDLSVILVRIDGFDQIVRRRGRVASDVLLKAMSEFLRASLREMDHVARYDGCIFGVLLPCVNHENALRIAERIAHQVASSPLKLGRRELALSVSTAVAHIQEGDSSEAIFARAEQALAGGRAAPALADAQ